MTDTQEMVRGLFKDRYGNPVILTPYQDLIYSSIVRRKIPRLHIMCHTRYGKSDTVSMAVDTVATMYPLKIAVIAGTKPKAKIIMDYVIQHIFDNEFMQQRFMPEKGESIDAIRRYKNKNHLSFVVEDPTAPMGTAKTLYSEVFIGSAKDALGFGADIVIEDEAALIPDNDHSLVMRMLGDNPTKNILVKIGNPFERNHFLASYHDPLYRKIVVDCYKSLKEGRITQQVIDENRPYSFFKILYECKFPSATEVDESGWMYLLTDEDIKTATQRKVEPAGSRRLGVDVARSGRNYNAWVMRGRNYAKVLDKNLDSDLISTADHTVNLMRDNGIAPEDVFIDDSGVGGGVTDYLKSLRININPVNFGERSGVADEYLNTKAEVYAGKEGLAAWLKQTGTLEAHKDWIELTRIRFKKDVSGRIKIEPKEDMMKRGIESPDVADALALTFANSARTQYYKVDPYAILSGGVKPMYPGMPG